MHPHGHTLPTKHLDNRHKYREYRVRFRTHGRKFVMARCNFLLFFFFCAFKCIFKCVLCVRWYGGGHCAKGFFGKKDAYGCVIQRRRRWDDNETLERTDGNSVLAARTVYTYRIKSFPSMANLSIFGKKLFFFRAMSKLYCNVTLPVVRDCVRV